MAEARVERAEVCRIGCSCATKCGCAPRLETNIYELGKIGWILYSRSKWGQCSITVKIPAGHEINFFRCIILPTIEKRWMGRQGGTKKSKDFIHNLWLRPGSNEQGMHYRITSYRLCSIQNPDAHHTLPSLKNRYLALGEISWIQDVAVYANRHTSIPIVICVVFECRTGLEEKRRDWCDFDLQGIRIAPGEHDK
jgi:hypothetical protein